MAQLKRVYFLQPANLRYLELYTARHNDRFGTTSQALNHIIECFQLYDLAEECERLLTPQFRATIRAELEAVIEGNSPHEAAS